MKTIIPASFMNGEKNAKAYKEFDKLHLELMKVVSDNDLLWERLTKTGEKDDAIKAESLRAIMFFIERFCSCVFYDRLEGMKELNELYLKLTGATE